MLKFATLTSDIELPFYTSLASYKINHDKLDDSARRLLGLYEIRPSEAPEASCRIQIHGNALTNDAVSAGSYRAEGMIKNVNTIEEYNSLDKGAILTQAGRTIWDAINDDLKRYKFTYLFAFPALHSEPPWRVVADSGNDVAGNSEQGTSGYVPLCLAGLETSALVDAVQTWRYGVDSRQWGFFLAKKRRGGPPGIIGEHTDTAGMQGGVDRRPTTPGMLHKDLDYEWVVGSVASFERGFFDGVDPDDSFVCFADPSTRWKLEKVRILCYRDIQSRRDDARSIILTLELAHATSSVTSFAGKPSSMQVELPKITGWERNSGGKVTSKIANLGEYMDPQRLADQAVDLNLKLIKWRIAPDLDLEKNKNTKCLLLGAGTLGSYVARNLMGWGVRSITFVDNGSVSFSNPVRQPLFNFQDCLGGGVKKAHRASDALKEIYPGVDSKGYVMSVPMAGHPIIDESTVKSEFETLRRLVDEHDAIFLLMDTRESRWLPTVMGKAAGKIVMNAALGFDTFVVMRHGLDHDSQIEQELGCYFCNDVVAPADSVTDRTLDQQCTVTRPGIAAIASALLVEIFVSLLQHPLGALAPAPTSPREDRGSHPLGIVPHQIRGFLSTYQNMVIKGNSYDCCSACSKKIISTYQSEGWHFIKRALNERGYVEGLSGLAEVQRSAESALADMELSDEGNTEDEEGDGQII